MPISVFIGSREGVARAKGELFEALAGHGIATALDALVIAGSTRDVAAVFVGGRRVAPTDTRAAYDAAVRALLP